MSHDVTRGMPSSAAGFRTALVLCGGMSTRMGRDKASLPFHGESLLSRVVRVVAPLVDEVVVVARSGQEIPSDLPTTVRIVRDGTAGAGPLAGIAAGLRAARAGLCFTTACDAPLLEPTLVRLLFERAESADASVAVGGGFMNPLLAVYRAEIVAHAEALLAAGMRRPVFLFDRVRTSVVAESEVRVADPELRSFHDCDTPEAYAEALVLALPRVVVEFFDVARLRAGQVNCAVRASTLGAAIAAAAVACPGLATDIAPAGVLSSHFRANVRGERFVDDPATPLHDGDTVLLLSAQAGG